MKLYSHPQPHASQRSHKYQTKGSSFISVPHYFGLLEVMPLQYGISPTKNNRSAMLQVYSLQFRLNFKKIFTLTNISARNGGQPTHYLCSSIFLPG